MNQDADHLQLLSIFHYVVGGITALFACFPLIHLAIGIAIVCGTFPERANHEAIPPFVGWLLICVATIFILAGWSLAVLIIVAGRFLARRTRHLFCLVMAAVECIVMPFGTVLGVLTIIVLNRPSVKALFESGGTTARP